MTVATRTLALALLLSAGAAAAQESEGAGADAGPAPASLATIPVDAPAAVPAGEAAQFDTVTVTARKREESIQDVPVAVTAFGQDQMDRRGFMGLEDLARATPGFTFEAYMTGGAHSSPVIRGLAQTHQTPRVQNVSFFLDGVYLQRQSMLDLGMVDLERIEIMKGPQNALYGRNAFAGAVNYITQAPERNAGGYLAQTLGDNDRRATRVSITGPLNDEGTVYGKVTAGQSRYRGHTRNDHPMADADPAGENLRGNLGGHDDATYSVSLAYEPLDLLKLRGSYYHSDLVHETGPGYSISGVRAAAYNLRFDYQNDLNCLPATVPDIGNPGVTHTGFSAWCGEVPTYASDLPDYDNGGTPEPARRVEGMVVDPRGIGTRTKTGLFTLSADYEVSPALAVHYLFGGARHDSYTDGGASDEDPVAGRGINVDATRDSQDPAAYVFANTASGRPNTELRETQHELRVDWTVSERLRASVGAYYARVQDQEWTTLFIMDLCNADTAENRLHCNLPISAPNHIAEQTVLTAGAAYDLYVRQHGGRLRGEWTAFDDTASALFASVGYEVTETIGATLEARYSVEKKVIDRLTDFFMLAPGETVTYTNPPDPIIPGLGDSVSSSIVVPHDEATFSDFTPRGILSWDWSPANMLYLSAARGVKAGGFNNSSTPGEQRYPQEVNWTYELGSKNRLLGFMTVNAALYYIDWSALQGQVPPENVSLSSSDITLNIGSASSVGLELDAAANLSRALSVDIALSFSDPRYDDGVIFGSAAPDPDGEAQKIFCDGVVCPADGSIGGNQLAYTSRRQYSAGVNYATDVAGWTLAGRLDTNYQSRQFIEPVNLAWVPARQISNASLAVHFPDWHWEIDSWIKNITDEDYAANSLYIGVFDQYMIGKGMPRTFGATLKYKF